MSIKLEIYRNSIVLMVIALLGLITGCQPPTTAKSTKDIDEPVSAIVISNNSVTMGSEYIISIKPSRYQPSLGLQGDIAAVKRIQLMAAQDVVIKQVLVTDEQWVAKGMPLFILEYQSTFSQASTINRLANQLPSGDNDLSQDHDNSEQPLSSTAVIADSNSVKNEAIDSNHKSLDYEDKKTNSITIRASFSGRIDGLYVKENQAVAKDTLLLHLADDRELRFIATLPIQAEPQLSVGQSVNFAADNIKERFNGQISALKIIEQPEQLQVYVDIINDDTNRDKLRPNMTATGWVDYGQIEVGTIMPGYGIHDVDLSSLRQPPYRPLSPLSANVWIIKQDQRLTRQPIEVIEYDPNTNQYLIAGINNDSLICLAKLPVESAGKKVIVS